MIGFSQLVEGMDVWGRRLASRYARRSRATIRPRTSHRIAVRGVVFGMLATQTNPTLPVNGAGPVARVAFLGLQVGTFPMNWINAQLSAPGGVPITPVNTQACTVTFYDPLAVTLANFEAMPVSYHILAAWETASEIGNRGFNLYRATTPAAPEQQLNALLIPSQASGSGQGYAYVPILLAMVSYPG